jgi:hypothetical protein
MEIPTWYFHQSFVLFFIFYLFIFTVVHVTTLKMVTPIPVATYLSQVRLSSYVVEPPP